MQKNKLTKFAWLISIVYFIVIVWLRCYNGCSPMILISMNLNEFGDFLAGVFAPLAFFWLVIGYFQSKEALELQAKELAKLLGEQAPQSLWVWLQIYRDKTWCIKLRNWFPPKTVPSSTFIRAYTGDELGSLLPKKFVTRKGNHYLYLDSSLDFTYFYKTIGGVPIVRASDEHEAHTKAALVIQLLKQKIINPEDFKYEKDNIKK